MEDLFGGGEDKQRRGDGSYYQTYWTYGLKPAMGLPAQKMVIIQEWSLGLLLRLSQLCVIIVLAQQMIVKQGYLVPGLPTGTVFASVDSSMLVAGQMSEAAKIPIKERTFCRPAWQVDYAYAKDEDMTFNVSACSALSTAELVSNEIKGLFIQTLQKRAFVERVDSPVFRATPDQCQEALTASGAFCSQGPMVDVLSTHIQGAAQYMWQSQNMEGTYDMAHNGTCICKYEVVALTVGTDDLVLAMDHQYTANVARESFFGSEVETRVRLMDSLEDLVVFEAGQNPVASMSQWLRWASVDLDKPSNEEPNFQWVSKTNQVPGPTNAYTGKLGYESGKWPYPRTSGLELNMQFNYYNYRKAPGVKYKWNWKFWEGLKTAPTICILSLRPKIGWKVRYKSVQPLKLFPNERAITVAGMATGAVVTFESTGQIYAFSTENLMKGLTNAIVVLGLAGTVCMLIARYGLKNKSAFYNAIIVEKVSVAKTYAQFAVRMIVASIFFDIIDDNASGEISKSEIFEKLRRLLQGRCTLEQTASLVEFMMEAADTGEVEEGMQEEEDDAHKNGTIAKTDAEIEDSLNPFGAGAKLGGKGRSKGDKPVNSEAEMQEIDPEALEDERMANESTINREEWVNIYVGPPCTVDSCVELIQRKNKQDRYLISKADQREYERLDKEIREEYAQNMLAALEGEVDDKTPQHMVKRKAARLYRRQKHEIEQMQEQVTQTKAALAKMHKILKRMHPELAVQPEIPTKEANDKNAEDVQPDDVKVKMSAEPESVLSSMWGIFGVSSDPVTETKPEVNEDAATTSDNAEGKKKKKKKNKEN